MLLLENKKFVQEASDMALELKKHQEDIIVSWQLSVTFFLNFKSRGTLKYMCLSQGFYSCTNIMTKKQVGEERVYSAYTSMLLFITKGSQDWNSSRSGSRS
jgi:hypothetical protein